MDVPVLANQQELIYINFVQIQDLVWNNCQGQWMIGTDEERERERERERETGNRCSQHDFEMMINF